MFVTVTALAAGAVVGLALGALGGGGSVLAVPALIYLLGLTPAAAATASLLIVLATSATALYGHARDGQVRWRTGAVFAAAGLVPAALGGLLAARVPERLLTVGFVTVAGFAAVRMVRRDPARDGAEARMVRRAPARDGAEARMARRDPAPDGAEARNVRRAPAPDGAAVRRVCRDPAPDGAAVRMAHQDPTPDAGPMRRRSAPAVAGAGAGLGAVTGVLGVGGGFLTVPALVQVVGLRMRPAVGTSLLVVAVNALAALLARSGTAAPLDWAVVAPFAGAAVLGAWDGRRLAARVPADRLRRAFGFLLLAVAGLMLLDLLL
ncbi:sulfite exporter TauE/SafE family protein [Streptomyces sp. NPDC101160]|uniref:sulfite exporter TauE/SafE family protein n=1 Tax=Streptomyces sp. NPDC101160 TaxID=3366118 RepID=UPI003813DA79